MRPHLFNTRHGSPSARLALAVTLLIAACAVALALVSQPADASIAAKQDQLSKVRDQQANVADQIAASNSQINALIAKVSDARQQEEAAAAQLAAKEKELAAASNDLADGRDHLQDVRAQLKRAVHELERIVVGVYKSDDPSVLDALMQSSSWEDASVDAEYLNRIHDYQADTVTRVTDLRADAADTVDRLETAKTRIQNARDDIADRQAELADVRTSLESQEANLAAAKAARKDTLNSLAAREGTLEHNISKAQQRQAAVPPPIPTSPDSPDVAAPPVSAPTPAPSGSTATLNSDGTATAPADAPPQVVAAIEAANAISGMPYVWGGGHGSFDSSGYDCSGAVSYALHGGGFLSSPLDSTGLGYWGEDGAGNWITVYANSGHAWMMIAGLRFDTSDTGGDGPRWSASASSWESGQSWAVRHPAGF